MKPAATASQPVDSALLQPDGHPSLEVRNLTVLTDAGSSVVEDVSFAVAAGEVLGLVGESGSGKTTIALALLGHVRRGLRLTGGQVLLGGRDLLLMPAKELRSVRGREIAYVPQDPASALNPALRVGRQVAESLRIHGVAADEAAARTVEVLGEVGIDVDAGVLNKFPHQMSGGQQQRVALAMAFACRPQVIILDEPTTGLDVSVQKQVLGTMVELCETYGVGGVYVSHDLAVVSDVATRVGVAYAGRLVELGPSAGVLGNPLHPYTSGLLASVPSAEAGQILTGIPGQPPQVGDRSTGCAFAARCDRRTEVCETSQPPQTSIGETQVRCFNAGARPRTLGRATLARPSRDVPEPRLQVSGLQAQHGHREILRDIALTVGRGECVAVVGESGAGKTTLAQCIAGLHPQWTGSIQVDGVPLPSDVRQRSRDSLRQVQYVFQNPYAALNPRKTVQQAVTEPLQHFFDMSRAAAEEQAMRVLDEVAVAPALRDRYPDQLSGGQRQRVAIARAVAVRPTVLVCDEVTSALDVSVQAVIVEMLRRLQVEHELSLVFITHNLGLVRSIAQEAVVLRQGRIVEQGSVERILGAPTDPYTQGLIGDMPTLRFGPDAEGSTP